ncbi:hypothetical protein QMZ05_31255 [Bradyrhizobium sp. INPA03-11B]|uniref:hypothetical protein n=1 Tax=Bradyrhizobium sp. INPA03-11B TaxID=418598 RepID=UPI00338D5FC5
MTPPQYRLAAGAAVGRRAAAIFDLGIALYRDRKVSDAVYKAAQEKFGELGIMGYYDLVSMTLITMQAGSANNGVAPLPVLEK